MMTEDATIIGVTLSLIGGFYTILRWTINGKLNDIRDRLENLEHSTCELNSKVTKLCAQVAQCQTDIKWLKGDKGG